MKNQVFKNTSFLCSAITCILPAARASAATPTETKRPNILIIQCDQQRYDCLGYTGNPIVKTPNIDRLAAQGMQFTRAYTPIPTSCPARQCLLSGQWPEQHGGLWNYDITLPVRLFDSDTWTERLHDEGYRTGYVGKWHVHPTKTPLDFGFDDYVNEAQYAAWLKSEGKRLHRVNTGKTAMMGGYDSIDKETSSVHWFVRQAIELIRKYESEGKPWHLRLDYVEPHLPCYPVKEFYDRYASRSIPQWPNFPDDLENKPYIQRQQIFTINALNNREGRSNFKEVWICRGQHSDVYGVEEAPECYWAYTTERTEKEALKTYIAYYGTLKEAIIQIEIDRHKAGSPLFLEFARQVYEHKKVMSLW